MWRLSESKSRTCHDVPGRAGCSRPASQADTQHTTRRDGTQAAPAAGTSTRGSRSRAPSVPSGRNPCVSKASKRDPGVVDFHVISPVLLQFGAGHRPERHRRRSTFLSLGPRQRAAAQPASPWSSPGAWAPRRRACEAAWAPTLERTGRQTLTRTHQAQSPHRHGEVAPPTGASPGTGQACPWPRAGYAPGSEQAYKTAFQ